MGFSFLGCGSIDAPGYVKEILDMYKTGEVPANVADYDMTKAEMEEFLEGEYASLEKMLVEELGDEYLNDKAESLIGDCVRALCGCIKYDVSDECRKENGEDFVTVTSYPVELDEELEYLTTDFMEEWMETADTSLSTDELIKEYIADYIQEIIKILENTDELKYGEGQENEVRVYQEDGKYSFDEKDMEKVFEAFYSEF